MAKRIAILGATGSIGCQAVDVVARHRDLLQVEALTARRNVHLLAEQAKRLRPSVVGIADPTRYSALKELLPDIPCVAGEECDFLASDHPGVEMALISVVGVAGLKPVLACLEKGKKIALANKEALVSGGELVCDLRDRMRGVIYPVDSEHSAIFQCLQGNPSRGAIDRIWLTASGGPFRGKSAEEMARVTRADALQHPNWKMGEKITIDCATMMNKGLEVIEAHWLFNMPAERIGVVVHPQSVIHSMVAFKDGSLLAQLGMPDMRIPIQYALLEKERINCGAEEFDPFARASLTFERPDTRAFPALELAYEALRVGGTMPAVLNAANEQAVKAFLGGRIGFLDIARNTEKTMRKMIAHKNPSLEDIFEADGQAREICARLNM